MKQATRKTSTKTVTPFEHRLREAGWIVALALSALMLLALISHHSGDPGWSYAAASSTIHNWCGRVGAWFADVSFFLVGYLAFWLPLFLLAKGYALLTPTTKDTSFSIPHFLLRSTGFFTTLLGGSGLCALYGRVSALPMGPGGALGGFASIELMQLFGGLGAGLLLLAFLLSGLTLLFGLSWLNVFNWIGSFTLKTFSALKIKLTAKPSSRDDRQPATKMRLEPVFESANQALAMPMFEATGTALQELKPKRKAAAKRALPMPDEEAEDMVPVSFFKTTASSSELPPLSLLDPPAPVKPTYSSQTLEEMSQHVEMRLKEFGIEAQVVGVLPGPVITRFELLPAPGVKASRITSLAKDLARSLSVMSVRVVEVIPGKSVVGLEIPNEERELVRLSEILASNAYQEMRSPLCLALGKDISGYPVVVDITRMPHLLIAGTTGSGKSVALNAMLLSLLFKSTPNDVRMILIDPKMLELSIYEGIPHLLTPVVTDMKEAANALRWCVAEMERRYRFMASLGVRHIVGYNERLREAESTGESLIERLPVSLRAGLNGANPPPLPYIVVVIDEFADMMMVVGKKVEELITRLAQKARAAGIHLLLATQRPSVDVITGLIKANIPTRIAFQVSSKIDSRTILDQQGAEQLLGYGDMLYLPPGTAIPVRVHGAYVVDNEVHRVVADWKERSAPIYLDEVVEGFDDAMGSDGFMQEGNVGESDPLYDQALRIITESRRASISLVQRRLKIGYNRAARLLEDMERAGVVSEMQHNGTREVLAPPPVED